jgi:hypothetical protein
MFSGRSQSYGVVEILKGAIVLAMGSCLILVVLLKGESRAPQSGATSRVTSQAVWKPAPRQLAEIRNHCGQGGQPTRLTCFLDAMRAAGASPEALAFVIRLGQDPVYMRDFRSAGPVDIAYVVYPFDANYAYRVLILNGNPPLFDVDSPKIWKDIEQDAASRHLYPGDAEGRVTAGRHTTNFPLSRPLLGGGQELIEDYTVPLESGVATLFARLQFDQSGNFLGVSAQNVLERKDVGGPGGNTSLHYKLGDFFQLSFGVIGSNSGLVTPGDPAIVRELDHAVVAVFCAGPCVAQYTWTFEAVGRGETNLVFSTSSEDTTKGQITQPSEYRIHVD